MIPNTNTREERDAFFSKLTESELSSLSSSSSLWSLLLLPPPPPLLLLLLLSLLLLLRQCPRGAGRQQLASCVCRRRVWVCG
jgi:hypothetical protein